MPNGYHFDEASYAKLNLILRPLSKRLREFAKKYSMYYTEFPSLIDDKVKPLPNDIEIIKSASGAFSSSNIDLILRSNNISRLVVVGGLTDACVASTVRGAYDRGYLCTIVDDACITATQEDHDAAMRGLDKYYGWVTKTEEVLKHLN